MEEPTCQTKKMKKKVTFSFQVFLNSNLQEKEEHDISRRRSMFVIRNNVLHILRYTYILRTRSMSYERTCVPYNPYYGTHIYAGGGACSSCSYGTHIYVPYYPYYYICVSGDTSMFLCWYGRLIWVVEQGYSFLPKTHTWDSGTRQPPLKCPFRISLISGNSSLSLISVYWSLLRSSSRSLTFSCLDWRERNLPVIHTYPSRFPHTP